MVHHDFLQTAQSLRGLGPLVNAASTTAQRAGLENVVDGLANALTRMVDILSDITALEAGQLMVPENGQPLKSIIESTTAMLEPVAIERKLAWTSTSQSCRVSVPQVIARHAVMGLGLTALRMARRGEVKLEATLGKRASVVATFNGINPALSLNQTGFTQLPALAAAPEMPFVAPGPALLGRIASETGGRLSAATVGAGVHSLTLELPLKTL